MLRTSLDSTLKEYRDEVARLPPAERETFNKRVDDRMRTKFGIVNRVRLFWVFYAVAFAVGMCAAYWAGDKLLPKGKGDASPPV